MLLVSIRFTPAIFTPALINCSCSCIFLCVPSNTLNPCRILLLQVSGHLLRLCTALLCLPPVRHPGALEGVATCACAAAVTISTPCICAPWARHRQSCINSLACVESSSPPVHPASCAAIQWEFKKTIIDGLPANATGTGTLPPGCTHPATGLHAALIHLSHPPRPSPISAPCRWFWATRSTLSALTSTSLQLCKSTSTSCTCSSTCCRSSALHRARGPPHKLLTA